jgi:hypothetical protein
MSTTGHPRFVDEVERPSPGPDQMLVQVYATTVEVSLFST